MSRRLVSWVAARCLRWFYRAHRIMGRERVPATGPVLLIGNHPNDLPDVIAGLSTTTRPVRYIATVSVTSSAAARRTYEAMGVIPVARVRDARAMKARGVDMVAVNAAAAALVVQALAGGDVVGVFPEGGVHDVPEIGRLRTGVADMVLRYLHADAKNDVHIVPFGLQYEAPRTPGSDVIVQVGEPFSLRAWLQSQPAGQTGAAALTARFREALRAVTRNAATWEEGTTRDELVAARAAQLAPCDPLAAAPALVAHAQRVAAAAHADGPGPHAVRLRTVAHSLARAVERAGGIGTSALDHARLLYALDLQRQPDPVPRGAPWTGLPAALIGGVMHAPAWWLVWHLAHRSAKARADVVARSFVPGLYIMVAWYGLVTLAAAGALMAWGRSPLWALFLLVTLPRFGDLAMGWRARYRAYRLVARVQGWSTPERQALCAAAAALREAWEATPLD
ncbi:MAG: 1-acyl-sn-glycerol-3-phosphate acyltransferase [Gemmatimonas sp.]|jgi:1-acyl-sn-glycerol-3-phosphate acyltransferase|uniref:1-acyl-sn-glycerol-3-phosphate acyltransferase n=1 Tax=Gemmatimonas sp. TaxID=1962908 RepID=UPI00391F358F|nr:1-acyl-sn-glycerol-3-phosphate acyltransferase [Gemmatimonadota bacterium]